MKITSKKIVSLTLSAAMVVSMVSAMPVYADDLSSAHEHDHTDDAMFVSAPGEEDDRSLPLEDDAKPLITVSATEDPEHGIDGGASLDKTTFCDIPTVTIKATEGRTISSVTVLRNEEAYDLNVLCRYICNKCG